MTERDKNSILNAIGGLLLGMVIGLLVIFCFCSCTRTVYEPVETVRTEYKDREVEKLVADTVHDTRLVWIKGDTVVNIREKEHVRRVEIHDTCYIERCDTIRVPYPVEKELSKWERTKMDFGGMALGVIIATVCVAVIWLIKKFRK